MGPDDFKIGDAIVIAGAGRHSEGRVSGPAMLVKGDWFIRYRCGKTTGKLGGNSCCGSERLAPLEKVVHA